MTAPANLPGMPVLIAGISVARRYVLPNDFLTPTEQLSFGRATDVVCRRAASARAAARQLLAEHGFAEWQLPRRQSLPPLWPPGIIGSLSHCDEFSAAAIASSFEFAGIGIDIEPAEPISKDVLDIIATPREKAEVATDSVLSRILFCAKEAAYKAIYPLDGIFLEPTELAICFDKGTAVAQYGRYAHFALHIDDSITALAWVHKS